MFQHHELLHALDGQHLHPLAEQSLTRAAGAVQPESLDGPWVILQDLGDRLGEVPLLHWLHLYLQGLGHVEVMQHKQNLSLFMLL